MVRFLTTLAVCSVCLLAYTRASQSPPSPHTEPPAARQLPVEVLTITEADFADVPGVPPNCDGGVAPAFDFVLSE